jgi:hypothetical protein
MGSQSLLKVPGRVILRKLSPRPKDLASGVGDPSLCSHRPEAVSLREDDIPLFFKKVF